MSDASISAIDLRGFANPVHDAQIVFRAVLAAMSQPGVVVPLSAVPGAAQLPLTLAAAALTLFDYETPIALCGGYGTEAIFRYLAFHTGAPRAATFGQAAFVIADKHGYVPWDDLSPGTQEYPDRSATVLLPVTSFESGIQVSLRGPGIETDRLFRANELDEPFWRRAGQNAGLFPLGVDVILCGPARIAALPRSTIPAIPDNS